VIARDGEEAIRHAESEWNAQGRWQGQRDPALSERGRAQANELATSLARAGVEAIVASDLVRAHETALIVGRASLVHEKGEDVTAARRS